MSPLNEALIDRDLVTRAQSGDVEAVNTLIKAVRVAVHRYCRARLSTYSAGLEAAEDVTQEVCLAVVDALPHYQDRGAPFAALVFAIASNKVADAQRRYARTPVHVVEELPERPEPSLGPEQQTMARDDVAAALALLEQLPPTMTQTIRLRLEGLNADEVALTLGMTANAVRVSQHRGFARLRAMIKVSPEHAERFAHRTHLAAAA